MGINEKLKWDSAAENYQQVFALGISEYNRRVLDYLGSKGHISAGSRVLDIGCGVGKYGTYLAALGCCVVLNDISPKMLDFAKKNMESFPGTEFYCGDFADPDFSCGEGSFELVMSTMSPAVNSCESLIKMTGLSRGGCFAARFAQWSQPTRDKLLSLAGITVAEFDTPAGADCAAFEDSLRDAGIISEKQLQPYCWADLRTPTELALTCIRSCGLTPSDEMREKLFFAAEKLAAGQEFIKDEVNTVTAWYYWKGTAEK